MNRRLRLPLAASIAGHCCVLALLLLFLGRTPLPLVPLPAPRQGIEVALAPSEPIPPPPIPDLPPPPPPPPVVEEKPPPPPPIVEKKPPPEQRTPARVVVRPPPRRPPPRPEIERPPYRPPPVEPAYQPPPPAAPSMPAQTAAIPRPAAPPRPPGPLISGEYRAVLSAWLASHKHYPESARERGEEGQAVLRFRVARSGQVLSYGLVASTGHPDLDAAIDAMMRGATLPPFPADMTANDVEVTVPVHFRLER